MAIKRYYPSDITSHKKAQEALNISIDEINKINNNLIKFEFYESQEQSSNTYRYVMERIKDIKNNIQVLKNYYQKTNKTFNIEPKQEINIGFISFEE